MTTKAMTSEHDNPDRSGVVSNIQRQDVGAPKDAKHGVSVADKHANDKMDGIAVGRMDGAMDNGTVPPAGNNMMAPHGGGVAPVSPRLDGMTVPPESQKVKTPQNGVRWKVGDRILWRYIVLNELGQGGMGVVYRCLDTVGNVEVAVKVLPPEVSHSTAEMEEVRENFALVERLAHTNIVHYKTLEMDKATGDYYLVMEYVEGDSLKQWMRRMRRERKLTLETTLPILRQVAEALDDAHKQDIIHRDVKPDNVKIKMDGTVKVLDFGLAAQIQTSQAHVSKEMVARAGTNLYKSPEQWRASTRQGPAADQYALAVVAYEMLSGHVPFESNDMALLKAAVLNEMPEPVEGLPKYANAALMTGLAKEASGRYATCVDFVRALGGEKVKPKGVEAVGRKEDNRIWIGITIVIAIILAAVCGGIVFHAIHNKKVQKTTEQKKVAEVEQTQKKTEQERLAIEVKLVRQKAEYETAVASDSRPEQLEKPEPVDDKLVRSIQESIRRGGEKDMEAPGRHLAEKKKPSFNGIVMLPSGVKLKLVRIEPDCFTNTEINRKITLMSEYWLGVTEVTQGQWKAVGTARGNDNHFHGDDLPVESVSWDEAKAFCDDLNRRCKDQLPEGYHFDLPTEAQWEFAARGGYMSRGYEYSGGNNLDDVGWHQDNSEGQAHPVAQKRENELGLYDMNGNVWEWCRDWYDPNWSHDPETLAGMEIGSRRVNRGGSWFNSAKLCRLSYRDCNDPLRRDSGLGFRVALVRIQE